MNAIFSWNLDFKELVIENHTNSLKLLYHLICIYDYIKIVRGEIDIKDDALLASFEVKNGFMIYPKADPEMDELTKVEMECLNKSIEENKNLGYNDLVDKSHDSAYRKADRNNIISYEDMAISAGANEELIKYIISTAENRALSLR